MEIFKVLDSIKVGSNTAVTIKKGNINFKNGMGILDDNGNAHILLSIGMPRLKPEAIKDSLNLVDLLIAGDFSSENIYI